MKKILVTIVLLHSSFQTSRAFEPITVGALVFAGWSSIKVYKYTKQEQINKQFFQAAKDGRRADARALLREGANINVVIDAQTALHIACERGDLSFVKLLLEHSADLNVVDKQGRTPLVITVCGGEYHKLMVLLNSDPYINAYDKGRFIFSKINMQEYRKIASLLIEYNARSNIEDGLGSSALMYAVILQDLQMVQKLLAAGADTLCVDDRGLTIYDRAVLGKASDIQRELEKYGALAGPQLFSLLIRHGRADEALAHIHAIDLNNASHSNLHWAICMGNFNLFKALLQRNASVDLIGLLDCSPIFYAVGLGKLAAVINFLSYLVISSSSLFFKRSEIILSLDELSKLNSYIDLICFDPTHEEVFLEMAKMLIQHSVNLNVSCTFLGITPLHIAAAVGSRKMVNLLLQHGADPKKRDTQLGRTAYEYARAFGHKDVMYILKNA